MNKVTSAKGLGNIRTATTRHLSGMPQRKGTTYLDLYALAMEKQRLEQELAALDQHRGRIHERLKEVARAMGVLNQSADADRAAQATPGEAQQVGSGGESGGRQWKKMSVDY
ncbi:MAG: hypothetical protein Q7R39_02060 [Dehalococcoidia bacterium]|nr:hypothetical protein [Dehalococcoidia bacterium]